VAAELGTFLARADAPAGTSGAGVELLIGQVFAWSAGDRRVSVLGVVQTVTYAAAIVGSLTPGDTVAVLRCGGDHLVICEVADA
jgi:hypothetical protein